MGGMGNCENAYITSRNVNTQCNPHENVNDILHINTKIKCKIQMETHTYTHTHTHTHTHKPKIWISQIGLEQKDSCRRYHNTSLQITLQSHSNKNSFELWRNRHEDQINRIETPKMNLQN
jgi:hypothetical protein